MENVKLRFQEENKMGNVKLRFRQVHLDFHTSPDIPNVGVDFDPEEFVDTLERAKVNSITCFARCHHGYMYYDSKLFPEVVHPNLSNKNLLKEQIDACHKRGIRAPIYITVQWDHYMADKHPEWLARDEEGAPHYHSTFKEDGAAPKKGFYQNLCVNSPYRDYLKQQTKEILDSFSVDGLFYDIVNPIDCCCEHCQEGMKNEGMDYRKPEDRQKYGQKTIDEFKLDITQFIREYNQECTIFYNRGHISTAHRAVKDAYTHFELESLPSGEWGYMHFPITARYARNLGLDSLGMTGKFHTMWGDFHSFKNQEALEYECFRALALNLKCMIGDQLDPNGKISAPVYDLIGSVYAQIEKKEKWCEEAKHLTDIGVLTPEEFIDSRSLSGLPDSIVGVTRMLEESGHQFDIIDSNSSFDSYKVLILPDKIPVGEQLKMKIKHYLASGGKLIASYEAGLNESKTAFALEELGVELKGHAPYSPDFLLPQGVMKKGLAETEHVMYLRGLHVDAIDNAEVLVEAVKPYFNRAGEQFCSHMHTPSSGETVYPGVIKANSAIYFMHPIFTQYNHNHPSWCKKIFLNALNILLPEPLIKHKGPSSMQVTMNKQESQNRSIVHVLHYIPERRSKEIDIIEDIIPLYNINVSARLDGKEIKAVSIVPEQQPLEHSTDENYVSFSIPKIEGHQMIEIEYV